MNHNKIWITGLACLLGLSLVAQDAEWMRYPAISPDGKTIVFGYKGDLYKADVAGGTAVPLTVHQAHDMMPVWSRDGKYLAFASDRHGNFDVYVMPATGGEPTRLTYHSAPDYPYDFSPDGSTVLFGSARMSPVASIRFYSPRLFQNLYTVPVKGGKPLLISAAGAEFARYNSKGDAIIFQDRKGYEDPWRKHHTSSVTRDVWMLDLKTQTYRQMSGYAGEDREPVWSPDDRHIYYLSEQAGSIQNLYKRALVTREADRQLTRFDNHPVRHLSIAKNGTLCFTWNGGIYTMTDGGEPRKLSIQVYTDGRGNQPLPVAVTGNMSEFAVSPSGKEIAFVVRGEVFVTNADGATTKRITNTPQQERMLAWSPDSKTLYYSTERGNSWDIYKATVVRREEPYFFAATLVKEEPVIATVKEEFQPRVSPDGKEIAYLEERNVVRVYNLATKQSRTLLPEGHNYSYSDGDQYFEWTPDSKWLAADDGQGYWSRTNTALIPTDGSSPAVYPVNSGFGDGNAKFFMEGKMMTWASNREGRKSLALQGSRELDIYAVFFDKEGFDRFSLSKEEFALQEEMDKKDSTKKKRDSLAKASWKPDFAGLENRKVKLTNSSLTLSDYLLSPDGSKLYYLASTDRGYDLWVVDNRTRETKVLAKLGASGSSLQMAKDGKTLFMVNNGGLVKIDESGKVTPIAINGEMTLDETAERQYIYHHAWRQVAKKFYDPKIHGIDWAMYRDTYARFLPHINNNYDFQELLSELLGELNGSHTGGRYSPRPANADNTASLGIIFDETFAGNGLKVDEVLAGGPLDRAGVRLKPGHLIEQIDGEQVTEGADPARLLNRKAGKATLLSLFDPVAKLRYEETLKPISVAQETSLMYKRWIKKMEDMTDKLSGGKVGYVHVQGMNDGSYRETIDKVLGRNIDKEALIVDTRFNGGGWLHEDLLNFLTGRRYLDFAPQGNRLKDGEPIGRWAKPSAVVMSEGNYSDAFIFPYVYKQQGAGKLIGMPVPGTGTAVWWETQVDPTLVFGIPMVATIGKENRPTENLQVEPDIKMPLPYEAFLKGTDTQIEAAVKHLLETVQAGRKP